MPTWGDILQELEASKPGNNGTSDYDGVRRKYLGQLHGLTERNVVIYYTDWFRQGSRAVTISLEDMQAMMEVLKGLKGPSLDILIHSPGGSAEATRSVVEYLRCKFTDIRAFIPLAAMSAATMWALSCDEIVMGQHSQLGPIDPQLFLPSGSGAVPARAILDQFDQAKREIKADRALLTAWIPIIQQYGPALLKQSETAEALSRRLVREWLVKYMLNGQPDAKAKAARIARYFASYRKHQSHLMGIYRDDARSQGAKVTDLEVDPALQDAVLSVHHAAMHALGGTAVKIVENHLGKAFITHQTAMQVPMPVVLPGPALPPGGQPAPRPTPRPQPPQP